MKKLFKRLFTFILAVGIFTCYSPINAIAAGSTTPLENRMFNLYDLQGYTGYTVAIIVDQPVSNSRICIDSNYEVGHTYIRVAKHGTGGWVSYYGWYPSSGLGSKDILLNSDIAGELKFFYDSTHPWDVAKVFKITEANATKIIDYAKVYAASWGYFYNISANNCTTFAVRTLESIGITSSTHGITQHWWTKPTWLTEQNIITKIANHYGYDPGDAAQDIRAKGSYIDFSNTITVAYPGSSLSSGSTGSNVTLLQKKLNFEGYNCGTPDGVFGAATKTAVINFQKAQGLTADGIVGLTTWNSLFNY